jgi:hypothetical protein
MLNRSLMSPGNVICGNTEDGGNALSLGRCGCPAAEQNCCHPARVEAAPFRQLCQRDLLLFAQILDRGRHDWDGPSIGESEVLFESELSIANVARVHRVSPTDIVDFDAKRLRDAFAFSRAGCPSTEGNSLDPYDGQLCPLGHVVDRQRRFFK